MIGSSIKRVLLIVTIGVLAASGSLTAHAQSKNPTLEWFSWSIF